MTDLVLARRALPGSREEGRRCDFVFFGLERGFFGDRDPDAKGPGRVRGRAVLRELVT